MINWLIITSYNRWIRQYQQLMKRECKQLKHKNVKLRVELVDWLTNRSCHLIPNLETTYLAKQFLKYRKSIDLKRKQALQKLIKEFKLKIQKQRRNR